MLPIPNLNKAFSETRKFKEKGLHRAIYRFSPNDYKEIDKIWNGVHPEDGQPLYVKDGPPEGAPIPDLEEKPEMFSPGLSSEEIEELAARLSRNI
ncbi:manganese catalase family protein [Paenibacillus sp. FSL M7-0802]|uniref:manganese catalase family protein n=1 Tax=Paenibacillus sp. FSL M7-0802 TaxID=2921536 RepID=UPI0006A74A7F